MKTGTHMAALVSYVPRLKNWQRWSNTILGKTHMAALVSIEGQRVCLYWGQIVLEVYLPILLYLCSS